MEKIKLVYLIGCMHQLAGMERIVAEKLNYLVQHTHWEVHLCTYEQGDVPLPFPVQEGVRYHALTVPVANRLQCATTLIYLRRYATMRRAFRRAFRTFLREVKPQVVVVPTYAFAVIDLVLGEAERGGVKVVMESHVQSKTVLFAQRFLFQKVWKGLMKRWDKYLLHSVHKAAGIIALTESDKQFWVPFVARTFVVPNMLTIRPVEVEDYAVHRVVAAGRYADQKGFDLLIKAWKQVAERFPDWQLVIRGNGDRSTYEALADKLGIGEKVHCLPATPDIVSEYSRSSIFVLSSRFEGFGLVLTEAMSCGLPCVSFDCPYGPSEIITDGEDGYLAPPKDVAQLAEKLMRLMGDEALRSTMGRRAKQNATRFGADKVMTQWMEVIRQLV